MAPAARGLALAALAAVVGGCATHGETPSVPWLIAANIRSLAGFPPTPPDFYKEPVRVSDGLKFTAITAGFEHTCALTIDGDTYCWGSNQYDQLGNGELTETCARGTIGCSSTPVRLEGAPRFTALAASMHGTCGLDASGRAHCWGDVFGAVPVEIPGGHAFVTLDSSPSGQLTCGLTAAGQAWCWGLKPPDGGGPYFLSGPDPVSASSAFAYIDVGGEHGCGIDAAGNASCWGANQFGQLGAGVSGLEGGVSESLVPVPVEGGLELALVASASSYSCGLDTTGALHCWGRGFPGDGYRRVPDRRTIAHGARPVRLWTTDPTWAEMRAGSLDTCGLTGDGEVYCFTATPTARDRRPRRVDSDEAFVAFTVGTGHACAIGEDAFAYCWGRSDRGQVGRPPER